VTKVKVYGIRKKTIVGNHISLIVRTQVWNVFDP